MFSKIKSLFLLSFCFSSIISAQNVSPIPFAETISLTELKNHVYFLTSNELHGRATGDIGLRRAAEYISNSFANDGVEKFEKCNGYYQNFQLIRYNFGKSYILLDNVRFYPHTIYCNKEINDSVNTETIFIGNASQKTLQQFDITNKAVVFLCNTLRESYDKAKYINSNYRNNTFIVILPNDVYREINSQYISLSRCDYPDKFEKTLKTEKNNLYHEIIHGESDIRLIFTNGSLFWRKNNQIIYKNIFDKSYNELKKIAEEADKGNDKLLINFPHYSLNYEMEYKAVLDTIETSNIIGYIKGTNKKDEAIIITAHYDALGMKSRSNICYGADDNASGTAALMEIAQAFTKAVKKGWAPKRTIIFIAFSAEENEKLGSLYYIKRPMFPLKNTILNINMDMIGRNKSDSISNSNHVLSFSDGNIQKKYTEILNKYNKFTKLDLITVPDKNYPEEINWIEFSDHYSFNKEGVPVALFYTGNDLDYHSNKDTPDKLNYEKMTRITQLIFYSIWEIANQ